MINKYKVAIIHYWLDDYRGGEKIIEALCEMFPTADIYTHIYKPEKLPKTITSHKIHVSFISKLPFAKKYYRCYLPLMPIALRCLKLKKYDLIISSESGPAKGIRKRKDTLHICYCHSPMRYVWDMEKEYLDRLKLKINNNKIKILSKLFCLIYVPLWKVFICWMKCWDKYSVYSVDFFIANSKFVAIRIRKFYKRKAIVISPPVDVHKFQHNKKRADFYLCVSELVSYKRVDMVVKAFNILNLPLTVIGKGPEFNMIKKLAKDNIQIIGNVSDEILKNKFETCKAFVFAGKEDFGIVFAEALSAGAPVIAYGKGGVKDIITNNKTGFFFRHQSVETIINAVKNFENSNKKLLSPENIAKDAEKFTKESFIKNITETIMKSGL